MTDTIKTWQYRMAQAGYAEAFLHPRSFMQEEIDELRATLAQQAEQVPECWCGTCVPNGLNNMRMILCPDCGNKRCPKANDHHNACTNSNDVGQKGSSWEHVATAPKGEV